MKKVNILDDIRKVAFFGNFPPIMLGRLTDFIEIKLFTKDENILTEGQTNSKLFFIKSGTLGIYVKGERVTQLQNPGSSIGELSLLSEKKVSATVKAESNAELLCIDLIRLKNEAPNIVAYLEENKFEIFTEILAQRLIETNNKARLFEKANQELIEAKNNLEKLNSELESRVKDRTQELREKNSSLEEAVANNKQLVRLLCHDLSNTLAIIQNTAAMALLTPKTEAEKKSWDRIKRASDKERDIITFVKECMALESGKMKLKLSPVNVHEVVESARFIFLERLTKKGIELKVEVPANLFVQAEPVSLSNSVFNNLISNAIKFTPAGKCIHIHTLQNDDNTTSIQIRDEGVGIPKKNLDELFLMSAQTSRPGTDGETGTGFGMPLVKAHMDAYGGEIRVESVENRGTTCTLTFRKTT